MPRPAAVLPLAMLVAFIAGCGKHEVKYYEAPKDVPSPLASKQPAPMPAADSVPAAPASAKPTWTKPEAWTEKPASSMRLASFSSAEKDGESADISVITLGGPAGGMLANVNRWRGQIGLEPVDDAALKPMLTEIQIGGQPAALLAMAGTQPPAGKTKPQRTIAATVEMAGQTWFFKMTGEDSVVAAEKGAFIEFLNSIRF